MYSRQCLSQSFSRTWYQIYKTQWRRTFQKFKTLKNSHFSLGQQFSPLRVSQLCCHWRTMQKNPKIFRRYKFSQLFICLIYLGFEYWNGDGHSSLPIHGHPWLFNFWWWYLWFRNLEPARGGTLCIRQNPLYLCDFCVFCCSILCSDNILMAAIERKISHGRIRYLSLSNQQSDKKAI